MKAVVFDLDGTLIDSAPDIRAAANAVLTEAGARTLSLEEARRCVGSGAPVFVTRAMALAGLPDDAGLHARLLARFIEHYEGAVALSSLYPGSVEALDALASDGFRLGLCTNKPGGPTRAVLEHFDLARRFGTVVAGDSLPVRKPDPTPLARAFAELGASGGIFVGDSEVDAETAAALGCPFLLFSGGYRQKPVEALAHDFAFDHHDALPVLVREAMAPGRARA